jgi:hypothetical protein
MFDGASPSKLYNNLIQIVIDLVIILGGQKNVTNCNKHKSSRFNITILELYTAPV